MYDGFSNLQQKNNIGNFKMADKCTQIFLITKKIPYLATK